MQIRIFKQDFVVRWWLLLITVAAFLLLIKLSGWQWQRAEQKQQQLQQIELWQQRGAPDWQTLLRYPLAELDGAPLQAQARWLAPAVWLVDNQLWQGRPGYDVLIPVQLTPNTPALLVNLGWVAAPESRQQLPPVQIPAQLQLSGLLRTKLGAFRLGDNLEAVGKWPMRVQTIDPPSLAQSVDFPLFQGVFYQQQTPFLHHYQPVVLPPAKHRAYALQWLLLAVAVLIVAAAASVRKEV